MRLLKEHSGTLQHWRSRESGNIYFVLVSRLTGVVVLTAAIGVVPIAPPEHVHETREEGHHHQLVVHRHSQAHGASHHSAEHEGLLEDDDGPVLVLPATYTVPPAPNGAIAAPSTVVRLIEPPSVKSLHRPADFVEQLIHGPPRAPASPRAPPFSPAL